jgi:hypothetical protein
MPQPLANVLFDFVSGLSDFHQPDDLKELEEAPTPRVVDPVGVMTTYVARKIFKDHQRTEFGKALNQYEGGESGENADGMPLRKINDELKGHGFEVEMVTTARGAYPDQKRIEALVLVHFRGEFSRLLARFDTEKARRKKEEAVSDESNVDQAITSAIEGEGSRTVIPFERPRHR